MNSSRRIVAVLLVLLALPLDFAHPAEENATEETENPLGLAIDPRAGLQLQAAADYVKEEDWKNAIRLLQHLLDGPPGALAHLAGRDGKADRYVGVHAEAERLLAAMPDAGRAVYQRTVGHAPRTPTEGNGHALNAPALVWTEPSR